MDTRELFARLIKCEAGAKGSTHEGGCHRGDEPVRVPYGEYQRLNQGNLRRVIEQFCQFTCVKTVLSSGPNPQHIWMSTPEISTSRSPTGP